MQLPVTILPAVSVSVPLVPMIMLLNPPAVSVTVEDGDWKTVTLFNVRLLTRFV